MYPNPHAGRRRRWLVALVPIALMIAVPSALAFAYQSRIAEQLLRGAVMAPVFMGILLTVMAALSLSHYRRSAPQQRQFAAACAAASGGFGTWTVLHVVSIIDAPMPEELRWFGMSDAAGWFWAAGVAGGTAIGVLAWVLAWTEAPPAATTAPPEDAPTLRLRPRQKALFAATTWVRTNLRTGAALVAVGAVLTVVSAFQDNVLVPGLIFVAIGLWNLAQSHARLRIDDRGVALATAGTLTSTIPYPHITQATVLETSPRSDAFPPAGGDRGWGATTGEGPALHLQLTDGRAFVFSTPEAETAAALVNGYLHRERSHADHD